MAQLLRKIFLLTWKNMKLLQRHYFKTAFEILIPILLFLIIAIVQSKSYERIVTVIDKPTYFKQIDGLNLKFPYENTDVYYTPSSNFTDRLMKDARKRLDVKEVTSVASESDLELLYIANYENFTKKAMVAVIFLTADPATKNLNYRIRAASDWSSNWRTNQLFPSYRTPGPSLGPGPETTIYFESGFLALQQAIDWSFINSVKPTNTPSLNYFVEAFPYPPYTKINKPNIESTIMMSFLLYGYTLLCVNVIGKIVEDKHSGVTELLKLMGLSRPMLWLTWFIQVMFIKLIIVSIITVFLVVPFDATAGAVFEESNGFLVWILLMFASVAIVIFWFMITTFFSRAWLAVTLGVIVWVLSYSIAEAVIDNYSPLGFFPKLLSTLLPSVALSWGLKIIVAYESNNEGLQWGNLFTAPSRSRKDLTMGNVIIMLIFDSFVYGFLTWYIDAILPGIYGIPEPLNFFLRKSYWQTGKVESPRPTYGSADTLIDAYESPPHGLKVGIRIVNLHKEFHNKTAVDGVTIDIYQDQITALLGHNGAGKTTTMSIMTGMLPATSGSVWINDYNIRTDMSKVRESLGLCPQHDMLFNDLTVKEHLIFFGMLKGLTYSEATSSAFDLLDKMHIREKADSMAATLSGGMKRKLSLGIALIGGSKVVILDEPTSGLDPEARRHIWDLLLGMRGERTILITTHFMEEADVLGDRIAIMDHGRVQCYGTSLYLKNKYGAGYVLKLLTHPTHDVDKITELVDSKVAGARLRSRLGSELAYTLPQERKPQFPELFSALESSKQTLGINSVGVSITTMEDVFLQVGHDVVDGRGDEHAVPQSDSDQSLHSGKRPRTTGMERLTQQAQALIVKKLIYMRRKWVSCLFNAVLAILLMVLVVVLSSISLGDYSLPESPALPLSLDQYGPTPVLFTDSNTSLTQRYKQLVEKVGSEPRAISDRIGVSDSLLRMGIMDLGLYESLVVAAEFNISAQALDVSAMYSGFAYHGAPISVNMLNNALLKSYVGNGYSIAVANHPLHFKLTMHQSNQTLSVVWWSLLIPLGLLFVVGTCLAFPLEERVSGAKHLQIMAGVRPISYWLTCFVCDFFFYLLVVMAMVIVLAVGDVHGYFGGAREAGVLILVLLMYGCSAIPFAYLFSYFKKTAASGLSVFISVNFLIGLILPTVMMILESLANRDWENTIEVLEKVFFLLPQFNIFYAVRNFAILAVRINECASMTEEKKENICPGVEDVSFTAYDSKDATLGWMLTMFAVGCVFYFTLILLINHGLMAQLYEKVKRIVWRNRSTNQSEDEVDADVRIETDRVHGDGENALTVTDLMKKYGLREAAVKGVSFGVTSGGCFGLLGFNGAGKTTVFKMLTGVELPTRGDARIKGVTLNKNRAQFMSQIGYCPQFDAINDFLTGREMLQLFARLRGVDKRDVETTVDKWLKLLDLEEYKNLKCGKYSGGNKRKLSTAMALIGDPPLIFLDEPTTGVDPVARRNLWSVLARVQQQQDRAIVLTTHSMEECEALCSRLAIMVKGQFVCIGENQYLKQKFGQGFTVNIKLANMEGEDEQVSIVKNEFEKVFKRGNCNLKDQRHGLLHYHLTDPSIPWNYLFSNMESLKSRLEAVEDYTVSETTLEQVFLSFAKC